MSEQLPVTLPLHKKFDRSPPYWYRFLLTDDEFDPYYESDGEHRIHEYYKIKVRAIIKKHCFDGSYEEGYCSTFYLSEQEYGDNILRTKHIIRGFILAKDLDGEKPYLCRWEQKTECYGSRVCTLYDEYTIMKIKHIAGSSV
jgi:hypothetical protein